MLAPLRCHHCGEPVPPGVELAVELDGAAQPMCCPGCAAAAQFIRDQGLDDYYRYRSAPAPRPQPEGRRYESWVRLAAGGRDGDRLAVNLLVEGLRCPACAWLIERVLAREPGVHAISVNAATGRARLEVDGGPAALPPLLRALDRLGYRPHRLGDADTAGLALAERRAALRRLAVAGFGMMQVATFAVALYAGAFDGMDPRLREFLRLVSLLVATPVLFYAGRPFLAGAWRSIAARALSIDLPVGLALTLAWAASVWNSFAGHGEVYFDSVTMFVFLLLLGRYVEMTARHRAASTSEALLRLQPAEARRLGEAGAEPVEVAALRVGDRVQVLAGEAFPADGQVEGPATAADESLITGESTPVVKPPGAAVLAGAINAGPAVTVAVTATAGDTALAAIVRLLERAQSERPPLARAADRWAGWFLARVLGGTAIVAALWLWIDPSRAFEITLSVLVVTCPCALSLATPSAIAAATSALARAGVLVTRADALERLAQADCVCLDKTGTLTHGRPVISAVRALGDVPAREALAIAAALERHSAHPLSAAFAGLPTAGWVAADVVEASGAGLEGRVGGQTCRLGRRDFVAALAGPRELPDAALYLGSGGAWLLAADVTDRLRDEAPQAVAALRALGLEAEIASGDAEPAVAAAANAVGISHWSARLDPAGKIARLQAATARGRRVLAVGDGINDAPLLQAADVAVALGSGAALAQSAADLVLLDGRIDALPVAIRHARRALAVTRQNLLWATTYNLAALPAAALGYVPPWLAAIGMSLSSLVVVLNATRLRRVR